MNHPIGVPGGWEEIAAFWSFHGDFPPDVDGMRDDIKNRVVQFATEPDVSPCYYDWRVGE